MLNNNLSNQTYEDILSTAYNFFIEKGYEKTSVQDIINELGISKGAIYHYFKSKEEILQSVLLLEKEKANIYLDKLIQEADGCNAKEKIKYVLNRLMSDEKINTTNRFLLNQTNNSKAIIQSIIQTVNIDSIKFFEIIKDGVKDGSLKTDFPKECSELLLLLCNIWLNPILFNRTYEETVNRFVFIQFTMKQLGVDVIGDELLDKVKNNLKGVGINENTK
ncbi:TetR/AcrR family transcriptional regulator [Romboutsia lituseburensis]|uniref:DNA-binding transcriptional regulator, AcrR family n=1 Tax=Romboutsia lituseburensis DSM 797 TaxID=1121325 RepID=A0A1G9PMX4_9FIRM|nr:TetR/AcrR family transcriptional regulator [Romboutsia lituseburensis]CEH33451.1 TetR-transcriptional regulator [Romboutsia lituseburensis]SDM00049.1 DNA-binding transcriptional regulator, AcrR family [Romboutsia lituseburensis DSM 797]